MGKSLGRKRQGIQEKRKRKKGIVLKEGGREGKILNFNHLLSIEISPEVKILKKKQFSTNSNKN